MEGEAQGISASVLDLEELYIKSVYSIKILDLKSTCPLGEIRTMIMCMGQGRIGAARDLHRSEVLHSFSQQSLQPHKILPRSTIGGTKFKVT